MRRASAAFLLGTAATAATSTACATFGPSAMTRVPADTQDPGARELTCLDVAAHPLGRERHESVSSLNVLYEFANRCARPVHLDFAAVPVDVRLSDERRETLVPEPVTGGRVSGTLDAFASGTEKIGCEAPRPPAIATSSASGSGSRP